MDNRAAIALFFTSCIFIIFVMSYFEVAVLDRFCWRERSTENKTGTLRLRFTPALMTTPRYEVTQQTSATIYRYVTFGTSFNDGRGLGNQLFNIASMLFVSDITGRLPAIMNVSYVTDVEKVFDVRIARYDETFLCPCRHIGESQSLLYDNKYEEIPADDSDNQTIWLAGFFQSWKYMRTIDRSLRRHLVFKTEVTSVVNQFLTRSIPPGWKKNFIRVGIHVRRGDVLSENQQQFGHSVPNVTYFERAMTYFVENYSSRIQFIVVSNDVTWCREQFNNITKTLTSDNNSLMTHNVTYSPGHHSNGEDLALLASCDHVIMSIGTFGWWGAWLAKGTTVYYTGWPRNGSSLASKFKREDFFPPSWIGMSEDVVYRR